MKKQNILNSLVAMTLILNSVLLLAQKCYALDVGDVAPDFRVITIDNKELSYEKDIKGKKPAYLVFWSSW